jgi:tetratricopeptide (TPR) repeat protein
MLGLQSKVTADNRPATYVEPYDVQISEADRCMAKGDFFAAEKILKAALAKSPYSQEVILALIRCSIRLGKDDFRLQLARCLVGIEPKSDHLLALADAYYDLGRDPEALTNYLSALRAQPNDNSDLFHVYKAMGNIFVRSHDFDSAVDNYNKAYRLNPQSPALLVNFGTLSIQKGQWGEAMDRFREAVLISDQCDGAWVGLAICHREFGDFELSWANLAKAMDANPLNRTALQLALGWVVKDQKWEPVTAWLENYLASRGDDAEMSLALAQLWFLRGRFYAAEMELTRALSLDPGLSGGTELANIIRAEKAKEIHGRDQSGKDLRP